MQLGAKAMRPKSQTSFQQSDEFKAYRVTKSVRKPIKNAPA